MNDNEHTDTFVSTYLYSNELNYSQSWFGVSGDLVLGNWYKMTFSILNQGSNLFDLELQIWNSDSDGVLGTLFTSKSQTGLSNPDIAEASTLYPYFANDGWRSSKMDNFYVEITEDEVICVESFEGAEYPPTGWELRQNGGDPSIELVTNDSENPTAYDTPYGDNYVRLPIKPDAPNNWAAIVSPRIDFPAGDGFYGLTMSIYITNNTTSNIRIQRLTASWGGDSYDVGFVTNTSSTAPVGWYEYSCYLGFMGGTSQYIGISVTSLLEEVRFDNIRIKEVNPWIDREPQNEATEVDVFPSFKWNNYNASTNTYSLYLSPDGLDYDLMYEGASNAARLDTTLAYDTTYYWYVVANEYESTVTSPIWTFTTEADTSPNVDDAIVDFPYLADFQVEDPLWYGLEFSKNAILGDPNTWEFGTNPPLQKGGTNMSKDGEEIWFRTLDGEANWAYMSPRGFMSALVSPYFYLTAGQTYEIKYNYKISDDADSLGAHQLMLLMVSDTSAEEIDDNTGITNTDYALRMITFTPEVTDYYFMGILCFSSVDTYVDNFRITQNGDDLVTAAAPTVDGAANPDPAPIYNTETGQPLDTDLYIENISGSPEITATVTWVAPEPGSPNTGLKLNLHAAERTLAGANITFIHNLGYTPASVSYRIVPNSFATMNNPNDGSWTASQCVFAVPAGKADGDFEVILQLEGDDTLPVELSSFTAMATQQNYLQLDWVTQSESGLVGYYIYRSSTNSLDTAQIVSNLITANNSSQEQLYTFTDREVEPGSWYYWLQNLEMDGQMGFYGSIHIELQMGGNNDTPDIPLITSIQSIYPNPFSSSTMIGFGLAKEERVNIQIFNVKGQLVRNLLSETKAAANYRIIWNGENDNGKPISSGIYYARMTAGNYNATSKLVIVK